MAPKRDLLKEHYEALDRETLTQQGAQLLKNNSVAAVRTSKIRLWFLAWTVIIMVGLAIGGFYLWVLYQAQVSGAKFAELRNEALKVMSDDE